MVMVDNLVESIAGDMECVGSSTVRGVLPYD